MSLSSGRGQAFSERPVASTSSTPSPRSLICLSRRSAGRAHASVLDTLLSSCASFGIPSETMRRAVRDTIDDGTFVSAHPPRMSLVNAVSEPMEGSSALIFEKLIITNLYSAVSASMDASSSVVYQTGQFVQATRAATRDE